MFIELTTVWGRTQTININNIAVLYPDPNQENKGTIIEVMHATAFNEDFSDYIWEYKESYEEVKQMIAYVMEDK